MQSRVNIRRLGHRSQFLLDKGDEGTVEMALYSQSVESFVWFDSTEEGIKLMRKAMYNKNDMIYLRPLSDTYPAIDAVIVSFGKGKLISTTIASKHDVTGPEAIKTVQLWVNAMTELGQPEVPLLFCLPPFIFDSFKEQAMAAFNYTSLRQYAINCEVRS